MSKAGLWCAVLAAAYVVSAFFADVSASDMRWSTGTYTNAQGRQAAYLAYGIPQTDAAQFHSSCPTGGNAQVFGAVLGYDPGGLKEGTRVDVRFFAGNRQVYQKPGRIFGTKLEVGVTGVRLWPSPNDNFWSVLSKGGVLTYHVDGLGTASIDTSGAAGPIARFTQTCKALLAGLSAGGAGGGKDPRRRSCNELGKLKSVESRQPVSITFVNRSGMYRGVLWLDYNGRAVDYEGLNPGASYTQKTFAGHPWMFTNGPGDCKEIYVPQAGDTRFDITVR